MRGNHSRLPYASIAFVALLIVFPFFAGEFNTVQLTEFLIFGLLAMSLDLIWGYAGIMSFGQLANFGIGGYVYAIVAINQLALPTEARTVTGTVQLRPGDTSLAFLIAIGAAAAFAFLIGYTLFYAPQRGVHGVFLSIITLADTLILATALVNTAGAFYTIGVVNLGGFNGIRPIPRLQVQPPGMPLYRFDNFSFYYFSLGVVLLLYFIMRRLVNSPFGRVVVAIRENEDRTEALGYDVRKYKLITFAISGAIAGLTGAMFAMWGSFFNPLIFGLVPSALLITWLLFGGVGTLIGPMIGAVILLFLQSNVGGVEILRTSTLLVLGIILIIVVMVAPRGLLPYLYERLLGGGGKSARAANA